MLKIKLARTQQELQGCFKLRKEVFINQHKFFKNQGDELFDDFDFLEGTKHIIAIFGNKVIGTIRYTDADISPVLPTDKFFNFKHIVQDKKWCVGSMFAVDNKHLLSKASYFIGVYFSFLAAIESKEIIVGCINPQAIRYFQKMSFLKASDEFQIPNYPQPVVAVYTTQERYSHFIEEFREKHDETVHFNFNDINPNDVNPYPDCPINNG